MKVLSCAALAICAFVAIPSDAQQGSESGVDFLGIYAPPIFDGGGPPRRRPDTLPLSDAGRQAVADYDPILDNPRIQDDCALESMPRLLWTGNPMALRQGEGDTLIIHYERGNTVRTVYMNGAAAPGDQPNSHLGYSVGRWEGDVLMIDTTHMLGLHLSGGTEPLSLEARVTERYWREPGSMDLQLELDIDDPLFYTEVFTMGREYIWAPEEEIREWVCVDFGDSTAPPDIDEMIRMLEEL